MIKTTGDFIKAILKLKSGSRRTAIILTSVVLLFTTLIYYLLSKNTESTSPQLTTYVTNAATSTDFLSHLPLRFIAYGATSAGPIDRLLVEEIEPPNIIQALYDDIHPDGVTDYIFLDPEKHYLQITKADNSQQLGIFNFYLSGYAGESLFG